MTTMSSSTLPPAAAWPAKFRRGQWLFALLALCAASRLEAAPVELWNGMLSLELPAAVRLDQRGGSYLLRSGKRPAEEMRLQIRRLSTPGIRDAGRLYVSQYEKIKRAGGYRVNGETSSGPTTGEYCEIRYLVKPRSDQARTHRVWAFYTKIGRTEWIELVLSVRRSSWKSPAAAALRRTLSTAMVAVP